MKILLQKGVLNSIDLHKIIDPTKKFINIGISTRQKIYAANCDDLPQFAQKHSFDCAVLQVFSVLEENLQQLRDTVRELHNQLPVGILNYLKVSLEDEFSRVANAEKYPVRIKDMQQEGASAELPAFLASLSGAFHGNENPVLDLGNGYTLDRAQRQLLDPNGKIVRTRSACFRMLEYMANEIEVPISAEDLDHYIWDMPDSDALSRIKTMRTNALSHLKDHLTEHPHINVLGAREGVPNKFICLSEHSHFADTFQAVIEKLDDSLKDATGFIIPLDDDQKLLRVGGLRFHTAYPMLSIDGAIKTMNKMQWKAMVSVVKSGSAGVSKENLGIRENACTDNYIPGSQIEENIISRVRKKLGCYKYIIPSKRDCGSQTLFKIDSEACEAAEQAYRARMAQQQAYDTDLDTYSP